MFSYAEYNYLGVHSPVAGGMVGYQNISMLDTGTRGSNHGDRFGEMPSPV